MRVFHYPSPHTVGHAAFLSRRICRDEEVIAVSTLRSPWRQQAFHSPRSLSQWPSFFHRRGIEVLQELSRRSTPLPFYPTIDSSWLMYDLNKSFACHGRQVNTLRLGGLRGKHLDGIDQLSAFVAFRLDWTGNMNFDCCEWLRLTKSQKPLYILPYQLITVW